MSIVASGTGKLTPMTKKQSEELEKFYEQELEEAKRLEDESKANKMDISSIHYTRHESSLDFGSDGFIDLDEQEGEIVMKILGMMMVLRHWIQTLFHDLSLMNN
jgi:hypothetical protein